MRDNSQHRELMEVLRETNRQIDELRKGLVDIMATLDADVQAATTVINDLVTALQAASSGVPEADQTALETAIAAGQAALTPAAPAEAPVEPVPETPVASPEVA
jgi:hypothetical protein